MPIYEYICESCEEEIEVIQKISEEPLTQCPSCKKNSLKKKTSMSAFHLKGGGWYKDGYGDNSSKGTSSGSSTSNSKTTTDTSPAKTGSTDSKDSSTKSGKSESKTSESTTTAPKSKAS